MFLKKSRLFIVFLLLLPIFITSYWFRNGNLLGAAESGLLFYDIESHLVNSNHAWTDYIVGSPSLHTTSSTPLYTFLSFFESLGISGYVLEIAFFSISLQLSFFGLYLLIRLFDKKIENKYIFLAIIFYIGNPISQIIIWNRFLYNHTLYFAILPLALYLFLKGLIDKDKIYALVTSIYLTIFAYALSAPAFLVLTWIIYFLSTVFLALFERKFKFYFLYFVITLTTFLLLNSWWITQIAISYFDVSVVASQTKLFNSSNNLDVLISLSDRLSKFTDVSRFAHADFSPNDIYTKAFGYLIFASGILFIVTNLHNKMQKLLAVFFFSSFIFISGARGLFGWLFTFLFERIFIMQFYRNPFEKFGFFFVLIFSILVALSFNKFFKGKYYILMLLLIIVWTRDFWLGDIFSYESNNQKISYEVVVPSDYKKINDSIDNKESRLLALPFSNEGLVYDWEERYIGVELSRVLIDNPSISLQTSVPYYSEVSKNILKNQANLNLYNYLPYLNIEYILIRNDVLTKSYGIPNFKDIDLNSHLLTGENLYKSEKYNLSLITENYYWDKFYISDNIISTNVSDFSVINEYSLGFPKVQNAIVDYSEKNYELANFNIVYPNKAFIPFVPGIQNNFTDQELIDNLTYIKHTPEKFYYPLLLIKENIETLTKKDASSFKKYQLDFLDKRAVELYYLIQSKSDVGLRKKAEDRYARYLDNILHFYTWDSASLNKLLYQYELLRRHEYVHIEKLDSYLQDINIKPHYDLPAIREGAGEYVIYKFFIPIESEYSIKSNANVNTWINGKKVDSVESHFFEKGTNEIAMLFPNDTLRIKTELASSATFDEENSFTIKVDVNENSNYSLNYDYRFLIGNSYNVSIIQNTDLIEIPLLSKRLRKNPYYHDFLNEKISFNTTPGTNKVEIIFSKAEPDCEVDDCTKNTLFMELKDINLVRNNIPEISLVSGEALDRNSSSKVEFNKLSPSIYNVYIKKVGSQPEIVVFSELFDRKWKMINQDFPHLKVNHYANGWIIDKEGEYQIELVYTPEKMLKYFKMLSTAAFTISNLIVLIHFIKKYL